MLSEWSAITRKSSGRESLTGYPVEDDEFLAEGESVGGIQVQPVSERTGVHRGAGVQVGIAPQDPSREVAAGVGRVALANRKGFLE